MCIRKVNGGIALVHNLQNVLHVLVKVAIR